MVEALYKPRRQAGGLMRDFTNVMAILGILLIAVVGLIADCALRSPEHGIDNEHHDDHVHG